jgi:hypothetical protein
MEKAGLVRLERVNKQSQADNNGKYLQARFTAVGEGCLDTTTEKIALWRHVRKRLGDALRAGIAWMQRRPNNSRQSTANPG